MSINQEKKIIWIFVFTLISMLGLFLHNSDLPNLTSLSPENSIPSLISITIFLLWWWLPNRKITTTLLLGWAILNLVGGLSSAIPFSFWSLGQLQTTGHLIKHTLYALAQLPLIISLIKLKGNIERNN